MLREDKALFKATLKAAALITGCMFACRFTAGAFALIILAVALCWAFTNKTGLCLCCYALFPVIMCSNYLLFPKNGILMTTVRVGPLLLSLAMLLSATRRQGEHKLPLGGLYVYLLAAMLSSIQGFCFPISMMKIVNVSVFLIGLWFGTQNLHKQPKDFLVLRGFFLGLSVTIVGISLATLPFPAIAYPINSGWLLANGMTVEDANAMMVASDGMNLFAGIFAHSQMLAPVSVSLFGYVLCDMMFIERKVTLLHGGLLLALPIMLFMTRSRTGLLSFSVAVCIILFYTSKRISLPFHLKRKVKSMVNFGACALFVVALIAQVSTGAMTRWIFKTNDATQLAEMKKDKLGAVTATRAGLMESSMDEFRRNPLLGSGFQVNVESAQHYKGLLSTMSAPVEKGVLPLVVLGEGGILGVLVFVGFLVSFYSTCARRRFYITIALFTVLLATNMGEATFFSPGGIGATVWVLTVGGGFCLDTMLAHRRIVEQTMYCRRW